MNKIYLDSTDPFYSEKVESNPVQPVQKPTKKKDDSIITTKLVIIMVIIAIVKIAVLVLWI